MNIQQLRAQIAALQDATMDENRNFRSGYDEGKFDALSAVDALLDSLQEEPVSDTQSPVVFYGLTGSVGNTKEEPVIEELEEASNTYIDNWYKLNNLDKESYPIDVEISKNDFKAGANWQKQQLLKDALDGYVTLTMTGVRTVAATIPDGKCGFDDKIKLVIIKED